MIKVKYTGDYPTTCMGDLIIYQNNIPIYRTESYSFHSTGSVWFDSDGNEHIGYGELKWNEEAGQKYFEWLSIQESKEEIANKVEEALDNVHVCCGGCI